MRNGLNCVKQTAGSYALVLAGAGLLAAQGAPGSGPPQAGPDNLTVLRAFENPVTQVYNISTQNDIFFPAGPFERRQYTNLIQPLLPFRVSDYWELVALPIIPVFYQPDLARPAGGTPALGDITPTFTFTPAHPGKVVWGLGPTFVLPTATDRTVGDGKFSIGPKVVLALQPTKPNMTILTFAINTWSVAGDASRPRVNKLLWVYGINFNLKSGWFLVTRPFVRANWLAPDHQRWLVPFGGGFGKVVRVGKLPVIPSVEAYYNAIRPDVPFFPNWQVRLNVGFVFPRTM